MQTITTCNLKLIFKISLSLGISVEIISVIESCLFQDTKCYPKGEKTNCVMFTAWQKKTSHIGIITCFSYGL